MRFHLPSTEGYVGLTTAEVYSMDVEISQVVFDAMRDSRLAAETAGRQSPQLLTFPENSRMLSENDCVEPCAS